jgi:hypothetical protein
MCTIAGAKVQLNYNCYNVYLNECLRCFHTCPLFLYHFSQSLYVNTLSEISVKKFRAFCALYVKYFVPLPSERQNQPCPGNQE